MAFATVTYTFVNGTTADASEVNTNFTDIINAFSDGSKDISMATATFATLTVTGNTQLGNATGDTIDVQGRFINNLIPSTDNARDLGTSALKWANLHVVGITSTGNTQLGDTSGDTLTVNAVLSSDLIPSANNVRDLGSSTVGFAEIWGLIFGSPSTVTFKTGSTTVGSYNASGLWALGESGGTQTHTIAGNLTITMGSGSDALLIVTPTTNTRLAAIEARAAASSSADAYYIASVNGGQKWAWGQDVSASSKFSLCASDVLGTNEFFSVTTAGIITLGDTGTYRTHLINGALRSGRSDMSDSGTINALAVGNRRFVRLTDSGALTLNGIAAGADGQELLLFHAGSGNLTINNLSGSASAADQIQTMTGAAVVSTGISFHQFIYDGSSATWILMNNNL